MNAVYDETGTLFRVGSRVASGGQGVVSHLEGITTHCLKVYHERPSALHEKKLRLLRSKASALNTIAALPTSIAFSDPKLSVPVGIIVPFVNGPEVYELYGTRARLQHFPKANFKFLVHTAYNLALAFEELHNQGLIIGDVNEQNVKVLADATIRLIDCDSFQISSNGCLYTSDVGTPIWTPPELQGKNLTGLERTRNHDVFGLAQLIFLLLFAGRHPFSGVPRGARQLSPEEAIREHAFAFAPQSLGLPLSPPPGCPPFVAIPPLLQECFLRAFLKGAELANSRPSASEWKPRLGELLRELAVCSRHPGHVFWKGATACPWCSVIRESGVDIFPSQSGHLLHSAGPNVQGDNYITRLTALRPHPFAVQHPIALTGLIATALPKPPAGLWSWILRTFFPRRWSNWWLGAAVRNNRQILVNGEAALRAALSEQQRAIGTYLREFNEIQGALRGVLQHLANPSIIRKEIESLVAGDRRRFELNQFLEQFQLRRANVRDIGPGRKATLQSYGIETAADITPAAIHKIPGFGPALTGHLITWRDGCESRFRFDPAKSLPPALINSVEGQFQQKVRALKEEAAKLESRINNAHKRCSEQLRVCQAKGIQVSRQRDQARLDLAELEGRLIR